MIYFISGHRDLSIEEFKKYYVPKIDKVNNEDDNATFIVGDCEGVDTFAMNYLYNESFTKFTICHMFKSPRNLPKNCTYGNNQIDLDITLIGGFKSDEERDAYMTEHSDFDIAYVKDNRWNSGTAQNIKRRLSI